MGEKIIYDADLRRLEESMQGVWNSLDVVTNNINVVSSQVDGVETAVHNFSSEFMEFYKIYRKDKFMADAQRKKIILENKIEKEFGNHNKIRRHTLGILQANDLELVRKETITEVTEKFMLDTDKYWLAAALVALSAWISDNKNLANRGLKEALRRDDEKTSLLFCLISRRAKRLETSKIWLKRYLGMQDPKSMKREIIPVLDAFANGVFGLDVKGECSNKINDWINELEQNVDFVDNQRDKWKKALESKKAIYDENDFSYLEEHSNTWPELKNSLGWAQTHRVIEKYFENIFERANAKKFILEEQLDSILENLVSYYDADELNIRADLRLQDIIIEESGDIEVARNRYNTEFEAYQELYDFSQHLTNIAMAPEASNSNPGTQKLAISLSKEWIMDAYQDLILEKRQEVPEKIQIKISNWTGSLVDGSEEQELVESISKHYDGEKEMRMKDLSIGAMHIVSLISGIGLIAAGLFGGSLFTLVLAFPAIAYWFVGQSKLKKKKKLLVKKYNSLKENAIQKLKGICAEVVDYRIMYKKEDKEYENVVSFLEELNPSQYIGSDFDKNRTII